MTCEEIEAADLAEKYILGQLGSDEQASYEQHYFGCTRCFEELRLRQTMQAELTAMAGRTPSSRLGRPPFTRPAWAVAAAILIAVGGFTFWRAVRPSRPAAPALARQAPVPVRENSSIEMLARVDPPPYTPPALRGGTNVDPRFRRAMEDYRQARYSAAIPGLAATVAADPKSADAQLFLGICYLMDGQTEPAIGRLRATIDLGPTLDLEMAHFYLAKALIRQHDTSGSERELQKTIALHGDLATQAKELLGKLRSAAGSR